MTQIHPDKSLTTHDTYTFRQEHFHTSHIHTLTRALPHMTHIHSEKIPSHMTHTHSDKSISIHDTYTL